MQCSMTRPVFNFQNQCSATQTNLRGCQKQPNSQCCIQLCICITMRYNITIHYNTMHYIALPFIKNMRFCALQSHLSYIGEKGLFEEVLPFSWKSKFLPKVNLQSHFIFLTVHGIAMHCMVTVHRTAQKQNAIAQLVSSIQAAVLHCQHTVASQMLPLSSILHVNAVII